MGEIKFSNHAILKLQVLKEHGITVHEDFVREVINSPDKVEKGYRERLVAQKGLDEKHVLRVVYENKTDHIVIVTMYPGRRERYEKNKI